VAVKSIVAYRHGLDLDPARPTAREVRAAVDRWLAASQRDGPTGRGGGRQRRAGGGPGKGAAGTAGSGVAGTAGSGAGGGVGEGAAGAAGNGGAVPVAGRLTDPVLLRHLLWAGLDTGLPLQVHTGFGDPDLTLHRADPALLTPFLRAAQPTGTPVVLLHCYPYHRNAAYLAHAFPGVHVDLGLTLNYTGARAGAVLAEFLELAPFGKVMFSTDAYGLPELYALGAALFRRHLQRLLAGWVAGQACSRADAERVARMIAAGNARQVYRLA